MHSIAKKIDKETKSNDFQFQLFWYCLYIDYVSI